MYANNQKGFLLRDGLISVLITALLSFLVLATIEIFYSQQDTQRNWMEQMHEENEAVFMGCQICEYTEGSAEIEEDSY